MNGLARLAKHAGMAVMDMYNKGITARQIMTKEAVLNALTVDMALGCSTNSMLHLPAIANEINVKIDFNHVNEISERTPNLCHLAPAGDTFMEDLDLAGGVYAVMKELEKKKLINDSLLTVTGRTVKENLSNVKNFDEEVIRNIDNPYTKQTNYEPLPEQSIEVTQDAALADQLDPHRWEKVNKETAEQQELERQMINDSVSKALEEADKNDPIVR